LSKKIKYFRSNAKELNMGLASVKSALFMMIIILIFLAAFCYDLGCSANTIRPGTGNRMLSISAASGMLTILTAVNLTLLFKGKIKRRSVKKGEVKLVCSPVKRP
jgi:O-antigen/teichoic acid export membrane protein